MSTPDFTSDINSLLSVSPDEVLIQLHKISKSTAGPGSIPVWLYKDFSDYLVPAISFLFNWCLFSGVMPSCLKTSHVQPVPKCNKPTCVNDFRPISITPFISKLFERIVASKYIIPLIKDNISASQFAYIPRVGAGTTCALVKLQNEILKFLDSPGFVRVLSVDLAKAFDKIQHDRIIDSCISFNFPVPLIRWIASFLTNRLQYVTVNNVFSQGVRMTSGVPQGSVIGPLLFAMSVNSLSPVNVNSTMIKYADDILLLHKFRVPSQDHLQDEWDNIVEWSNCIALPINFSKSIVMDIITKKNVDLKPIFVDNVNMLVNVSSFTYLGVTFSNNFSWNEHIKCIVRRASRKVFMIRNLRRCGSDPYLMLKTYQTFIRPILTYAFASYCNAPAYLLDELIKVERRIFRIMGMKCADELNIIAHATLMCTNLFQVILKEECHPLRDVFQKRPTNSCTRSHGCVLRPPFAKTKRYANSFIKFCK